MVGGQVVETIMLSDKVWVNTRDGSDECAIYVKRTNESRCISEGDSLWWQDRIAYWTPLAGGFSDRKLERIGYSGVSRPTSMEEEK